MLLGKHTADQGPFRVVYESRIIFLYCSGHIPSTKFGFLMKVPSSNGKECSIVEDVQNVLIECAQTRVSRISSL